MYNVFLPRNATPRLTAHTPRFRGDGRTPLKRGVCAVRRGVAFLGRNTLYIFLYHAMTQVILMETLYAASVTDIWHRRIIICMGMLILPAVGGALLGKAIRKVQAGDGTLE